MMNWSLIRIFANKEFVMSTVTSKDGTIIAYENHGTGPAVILVDGAMGYRGLAFGNSLANQLAQHFTVYTYDRRGRGESTNSKPFAIGREIEDIEALIDQAGGSAYVYGISSGACLALEAALKLGGKIKKLAIYEPPYNSDPASIAAWKEYRSQLSKLIDAGLNGEAVELFMRFVGTPAEMVEGMRKAPIWPMLEAIAPTLQYDAAEMGEDRRVPVSRVAGIRSPTLIMDGGANITIMPFMHATALALAKAIPGARQRTLENQTHDVKAEALAPVLVEFFSG
jgi:pimeloyl-ACP methyl ester carboxylesterase